MLKIFGIFIFTFLILSVKSFQLECEFKFIFYTCLSENFTKTSLDNLEGHGVNSVIGNHLENWNNTFVHRIIIRGSKWNFFPKNLTNFFPNVEVLHIENTKIKFLNSDDLKPFIKLTSLTITGNKIEKISSDLFKYTQNLKDLDLDENQIKIIESGTFNGLKKLNFFYIQNNPCTKDTKEIQTHAQNRNDVIQLIAKVEEKCRG